MRAFLFAALLGIVGTPTILAQQFTPPTLPPGVKGKADMAEGEILKVYTMEDQGATYRAYVVKYKGTEVVVDDQLGTTTKKVGDKITFFATRVEMPYKGSTIHTLSFKIMGVPAPKK